MRVLNHSGNHATRRTTGFHGASRIAMDQLSDTLSVAGRGGQNSSIAIKRPLRSQCEGIRRILLALAACGALPLLVPAANGLDLREIDSFPVPTNATMMLYSPAASALVLKNAASAVAVMDIGSRRSTIRFANVTFTDIALSPSGRYAFAADYGGDSTNYVHRIDLFNMTWDVRTAYIAGNVQAVSDTQILLKSLGQWVTFTNNAWGSDTALTPLNTPSGYWGPAYYAVVYDGDFRYDFRTERLLHGNSNLSSQEIQAFKIVNNEFIRQEGSGVYGSAQGYGPTVVLATDGSAFYYGKLQVDPLDVTHNTRVFPELIHAANGRIALGDGTYYDAVTGALLGALPFRTTVYAMNPQGDDFWAYDPATTTVHRFAPALSFYTLAPCRVLDTRNPDGPLGGPALSSNASRTFVPAGVCEIPGDAESLSVNVTITAPSDDGYLTLYPAGSVQSNVAVINFRAGRTRANNAVLPLGASRGFVVYCGQTSSPLTVQFIVDVNGFFK